MHRIRLPRWAVERGAALNDFAKLEPGRTALVVVDMQAAFLAEGQVFGNPHAREANMAGYKVIVVSDATAAVTDAEHNAALLNLRLNFADVRRTAEVLAMAGRAGPATAPRTPSTG